MRTPKSLLIPVAAITLSQPALAQTQGPPVLGYPVVVKETTGAKTKGELIAVSSDSLWLLRDQSLAVLPVSNLELIKVQQSSFGAGKAFTWSLLAGLGSGAILTLACSSVEDTSCGGILPGVMVSWLVIGGIGALAVGSAQHIEFAPPIPERIRSYSRFPQGLPAEFSRAGPDSAVTAPSRK